MLLYRSLLALVGALLCTQIVQPAILYAVTDLRPVTGSSGSVLTLNNEGEILGRDATGYFTYQAGQKQYLPSVPGGMFYPEALNDSGVVAGVVFGTSNPYLTTYSSGAYQVLGQVPAPFPTRSAQIFSINNAGQIGGDVLPYSGVMSIAFLYSNGTYTFASNSPQSGIESFGRAMNSQGEIVGVEQGGPAGSGAFLFSNGQITVIAPNGSSDASDINNFGEVVGRLGNGDVFTYSNGQLQDLGAFPSNAGMGNFVYKVNDSGEIVGLGNSANRSSIGWVYIPGTGFVDLNAAIDSSSGWRVTSAVSITSTGEILAYGSAGGTISPLLLTRLPHPNQPHSSL